MCKDCKNYIASDSQLLDLGCGSGIVGREFALYFNSEVLGIDIIDNRVLPIPFRLFSGDNLAFAKDNSFDGVLINFVLHHCKNPIELLKESKRVSKDVVILYENLPEGLLSKIFCFLHGTSFAYLFQKNSNKGIFYTDGQWRKIFNDLGFEVAYSKKVSAWFNPMKEQLYVLKKGV